MKPRTYIILSGAVLSAALVILLTKERTPSPAASTPMEQRTQLKTLPDAQPPVAEQAALQGTLWEAVAATPREAERRTIPIAADSFAPVATAREGERISLHLSERIPALEGTVTNTAVQEDGTRVTHIAVDGPPAGEMIVQENEEAGFFLAQLYYPGLPVAYQFRGTGDGLTAERHAVGDLICSTTEEGEVTQGLPSPEHAAKAKKPKVTTPTTVSLTGGTIVEGSSGTRSLNFTLTLTPALKKAVSFDYATANGTATAGSDYTTRQGKISVKSSAVISVPILPDTVVEPDETFTLTVANSSYGTTTATGTITNDDATVPTTPTEPSTVVVLNSLPGADACIYLDLDGQSVSGTAWYGGKLINALPAGISNEKVQEVWKRVSEDYLPFAVNVTTDANVFAATAPTRRIRCIITPTNEWSGNYGGIAYVSSFTWPGDTPCWVFSDVLSNSARFIADAVSHEVGHTLGLSHDGTGSVDYYEGQGTGATGWTPIMGSGYYQPLSQWSKGEYFGASNKQDDLAIIGGQNGFTFRADDHGNTPATATALTGSSPTAGGFIGTRDDVDAFAFTTAGGTVSFTISTIPLGSDVDLSAQILNASGTVVATANPLGALNATLSASLPAGTYTLVIDGVGEGTATAKGYTDYASLGAYTISGTVP